MLKSGIVAVVLSIAAATAVSLALAEGGPGNCGKGKVWDADQNKCVQKPRSTGSHAG